MVPQVAYAGSLHASRGEYQVDDRLTPPISVNSDRTENMSIFLGEWTTQLQDHDGDYGIETYFKSMLNLFLVQRICKGQHLVSTLVPMRGPAPFSSSNVRVATLIPTEI